MLHRPLESSFVGLSKPNLTHLSRHPFLHPKNLKNLQNLKTPCERHPPSKHQGLHVEADTVQDAEMNGIVAQISHVVGQAHVPEAMMGFRAVGTE